MKNFAHIAILTVALFLSPSAFAEEGKLGLGIGGNIGWGSMSFRSTTNGLSMNYQSSNMAYGGQLMYHFSPAWEIDLDFSNQEFSFPLSSTVSANSSLLTMMAELNYHLPDKWNPIYAGVRLGMGLISTRIPGTASNATYGSFGVGVQAGYDYSITQGLSIGPKVLVNIYESFSTPNEWYSSPAITTTVRGNFYAVDFQALAAIRWQI